VDKLSRKIVEGLAVNFDDRDGRPDDLNSALPGQGEASNGAKLTVADYYDIAEEQLEKSTPSLIDELQQDGHTEILHTFSVLQVGRRILVKRAKDAIWIRQASP